MVDLVEIFFTSSVVTAQNLVVVSYTVRAHVHKRSQKFGGTLRPLGWGHW